MDTSNWQDDRRDRRIDALEKRLFNLQMTLFWVGCVVLWAAMIATAIVTGNQN